MVVEISHAGINHGLLLQDQTWLTVGDGPQATRLCYLRRDGEGDGDGHMVLCGWEMWIDRSSGRAVDHA